VQHHEKVADGAIRRASAVIWWKKRVPAGNGAARRHDGAVAICWEVGEMEWLIWGKKCSSRLPAAFFGVAGTPAPPFALSFH
jgi:hypothetical protein